MSLKSILLFALGASAFTIPDGQIEGTYKVRRGADGKEVHTLIRSLTELSRNALPEAATTENTKFRFKRGPGLVGINEVTCNGVAIPKASADAAFAALQAECPNSGTFFDGEESYYTNVAGAVAYWCNIDPWGRNGCYGSEVYDAIVNRVSGLCGAYQTGWVKNAVRNVVIGYGTVETNFCTAEILVATSG